ncbi:MAG TPA: hypothetical protein VGG48_07195 [Rhizomicrobium sp.]
MILFGGISFSLMAQSAMAYYRFDRFPPNSFFAYLALHAVVICAGIGIMASESRVARAIALMACVLRGASSFYSLWLFFHWVEKYPQRDLEVYLAWLGWGLAPLMALVFLILSIVLARSLRRVAV